MNTLKVALLPDGRKAISFPDEQWKPFPPDERYFVSNLGRVYGPLGLKKASPNKGGHLIITFWVGGKHKSYSLNSLVCSLFNGEPPEGKHLALHNDHNPANCRADNLHWGSHKDNTREMFEAGRDQHTRRSCR